MSRAVILFWLLLLNAGSILLAQRAVDPTQRYFRIICLVHLTGSGKSGDPIVPEYVVKGVAVAQAAAQAAGANAAASSAGAGSGARSGPAVGTPLISSRPGILGWGMQISDDGRMAIVEMVAADHHAFDSILADTRPEIRVFELGRTDPAAIQAEMQKYRKSFDLSKFWVMVQ